MNRVQMEMALSDVPDMLKPAARRFLVMGSVDLAPLRKALAQAEKANDPASVAGLRKVLKFAEDVGQRSVRAFSILAGTSKSRPLTDVELHNTFEGEIDHTESILPGLVELAQARIDVIRRTRASNPNTLPPESPANAYARALREVAEQEERELETVVERGLYAYALMGNRIKS